MKFLSNIYDPKQQDAKFLLILQLDESREEAWHKQQMWLKDKIIGKPQPTSSYTIEQLEEMKMVGIYEQERN